MQATKLKELHSTLSEMYDAISFEEGEEPNLEKLNRVFQDDAKITRVTHEQKFHLDIDGFCSMISEMLDEGVFTAFYEYETERNTFVFGSIAHVLSVYETKSHPKAKDYLSRGVNSVQLVWENEKWEIISLAWDDTMEKIDELFETFQPQETYFELN